MLTHPSDGRGRRWVHGVLLGVVGFALAALLDGPAYRHFYRPGWERTHPFWILRVGGYAPLWIVLFVVARRLGSGERPRWWRDPRRAMVYAPFFGVILAEVGKVLIRRMRPSRFGDFDPLAFRPYSELTWTGRGLAFPSSHTACAVAAAAILCRLYPSARWIWIAWAAGCAVSRVAVRAHFVTDVYGGMLTGLAAAFLAERFVRFRDGA